MAPAARNPLTIAEFVSASGVSRETLERLKTYVDLLGSWQKAINLVAPDGLSDIWRRHILDSVQLINFLPKAPAGKTLKIADLGSGAGFPGLVLAILGAGEVHLIESDKRKCVFLAEVARKTGATVHIHSQRIEEIGEKLPFGRVDLVTARALAPISKLLEYAEPILKPGGVCLFLKGERVDEELTAASKEWIMQVEKWPSATAETGAVLRLGDISRGKSGK
jgi:16S rRNA (guanine527-N7)-methyltransferase